MSCSSKPEMRTSGRASARWVSKQRTIGARQSPWCSPWRAAALAAAVLRLQIIPFFALFGGGQRPPARGLPGSRGHVGVDVRSSRMGAQAHARRRPLGQHGSRTMKEALAGRGKRGVRKKNKAAPGERATGFGGDGLGVDQHGSAPSCRGFQNCRAICCKKSGGFMTPDGLEHFSSRLRPSRARAIPLEQPRRGRSGSRRGHMPRNLQAAHDLVLETPNITFFGVGDQLEGKLEDVLEAPCNHVRGCRRDTPNTVALRLVSNPCWGRWNCMAPVVQPGCCLLGGISAPDLADGRCWKRLMSPAARCASAIQGGFVDNDRHAEFGSSRTVL